MTVGEFYEKLTFILLLCNGWTTSGLRSIHHNADIGGVWDSLHQVAKGQDCELQDKDKEVPHATRPRLFSGIEKEVPFTYGELFTRMCERLGLLAFDEGDHYHVQPKWP